MQTLITVLQVLSAIFMTFAIIIQEKGGGMGEALGGVGGTTIQSTKRGAEKLLAQITVGLVVVFLVTSFLLNLI